MSARKRVLVTGGGTFLGDNIAAALIAEGADVSILVRPGAEDQLGILAKRARVWPADVWNPASLKGRGRGQQIVVHTVGGMRAEPSAGLTHHHLNFVSARNVAAMCISDGAPRFVLLSAAWAPWMDGRYLAAKREAERHIARVGLQPVIIRAPLVYVRGRPRGLHWRALTALGNLPPVSWTPLRRMAPLAVDVLARGVARIALSDSPPTRPVYAPALRRRNQPRELRRPTPLISAVDIVSVPTARRPDDPGENVPFGWTPPDKR